MMKIHGLSLALAATLAATCSTGLAHAQTADTTTQDKQFVMDASEGSMAEIAQSKVALRKSKNPDVKAYAQKMIDDHTKLRAAMAPFNQQMGVKTPQPLNEEHQEEARKLASLSGKDFDKEYISAMDKDHHKTLTKFQNEIATTQDATLKTAVQQGATDVQEHTQMADDLSQKMGLPVANANGQ
jgi:putative membrane protein